jgi:hypothetical protein
MPSLSPGALTRTLGERREDLAMLARLGRDLPRAFRAPIDAAEARARLRHRLANRERRLLAIAERAIYANPRSPYLTLLRHVGCELGDLRALLSREGLEGALTILANQGVYVRYDEFKGRREVVRGSLRLRFDPADFDNPFPRAHLIMFTGGSGRRPSRVRYSLDFLEEWAVTISLSCQAFGLERPAQAFWWPVPLAHTIMAGMLGHPVRGWFYPHQPLPRWVDWAARYLRLLGRAGGCRFPPPQYRGLDQPERLAAWLASQLRDGQPLLLWASSSAGARLGLAATQAGLDLRGATILTTGEAVTDARRQQMAGSGVQVIPAYSSVDVSAPAYGCATPLRTDELHVMDDRCALITHRRPASDGGPLDGGPLDGGPLVDALLSTALTPAAPKIALNCETGDHGLIEQRDCGCLFGALGLRRHLSEIRSFEKLTGEGVTFARTNVQQIVEEILPARFGGTLLDYQLAEEESPDGPTRLVLRVSPSVGDVDESALRATLLAELGRGGESDAYNARLWHGAGTVQVRREPPHVTRAGKVLPFEMLRRTAHPS